MRGIMSQRETAQDPQAFERANYIKILQGYGGGSPAFLIEGIDRWRPDNACDLCGYDGRTRSAVCADRVGLFRVS